MKNKFIAALALIALPAVSAVQAQVPLQVYAGGGTDVGTTLCYSVVSAYSVNSGQPVITYLNATSDKAASVVQFYSSSTPTRNTGVNSTVTLAVERTNGYASGDIVILRHVATDTYERRVLTTMTTATNLVLTVAPTVAMAAGDMVYKATTTGTIPVGAATKELNGSGIYAGQAGLPLLLEVDGTSACQINAVCAVYK